MGTARTQALIEGMNLLGYAAANVAERDLAMGYEEFRRRTEAAGFPFISANIVRQDTREPVFKPYVVLEAPGGEAPLRVGVTGVVRFNPVFLKSGPDKSNLVIAPPKEMVGRYIEELRKQADIIVVLAAIHRDDAHLLARDVPGLDVILGTYGSIYSTQDEAEGQTLIYYSGNQGRRIGETRLYVDSERRIASANSFIHNLTARYPSDTEMTAYVARAGERIHQLKQAEQGQQVGAAPASAGGSRAQAASGSGNGDAQR